MILKSSKVKEVLDGLFCSKTLCIIYFRKSQVKSGSMIMTMVIFDFNQEDLEDLDVLQDDGCS